MVRTRRSLMPKICDGSCSGCGLCVAELWCIHWWCEPAGEVETEPWCCGEKTGEYKRWLLFIYTWLFNIKEKYFWGFNHKLWAFKFIDCDFHCKIRCTIYINLFKKMGWDSPNKLCVIFLFFLAQLIPLPIYWSYSSLGKTYYSIYFLNMQLSVLSLYF